MLTGLNQQQVRALIHLAGTQPHSYQHIVAVIEELKRQNLETLVSQSDTESLFRAQGAYQALDELLELFSHPNTYLAREPE
jgi:hypothetical protein